MLKNEIESYVRIGEGFEKSYVPFMGVGEGVKNYQNRPYVINEWPLNTGLEFVLVSEK